MKSKLLPRGIPRSIWALGFVSMFMDISSEMIHGLLPIFMVSTLGASVTSVGIIEGIAEATALITKLGSGLLSDAIGKRKLLALAGYAMAAFTKPLFPLAHSLSMVLAARFIDRIGKGIRGAPRDALIGDIAPADIRGACFGLRQSLDTVGAFIGPFIAIVLMDLFGMELRYVLWVAVIPAFIAVALMAFGVEEPEQRTPAKARQPLRIADLRQIGRPFWQVVATASLFSLARFSEAFLILRAQSLGLAIGWAPIVMVVMSVVYALAAFPAGKLSDRVERKTLLMVGIGFLIAADLVLANASGIIMLFIGVGLWGLHMGFTQGILASMVTDASPSHLRASAYGLYSVCTGLCLLASSVLAGIMWDSWGADATFFAGAALAVAALASLLPKSNPL